MTQSDTEKRVDTLMQRFDDVNAFFIAKIAQQVAKVGELIPSTIHYIEIMAQMNEDIAAINQRIADALRLTLPDLFSLYEDAMKSNYSSPRFERALRETPLSSAARGRLEHYTEAVSRQTAGTLLNLSNTTIASQTYRHVVDKAVLAVSSGMTDYRSATRQSIRELGHNGLQLQYPSGYHRRLDTAVRQNIIDGANQIAQQGSIMMGEELGYDAYELSAHMRSAPDHEPVQGRVFLKEEFNKLQSEQPFQDVDGNQYNAIRRSIGEWNCMHIAMAFSTKYSKRQYSDELLAKWAESNQKGCMIDGKHYTTYEAAQLMRKIETQVRREKDTANAARIAGDEVLQRECQQRINALGRKYQEVAKAANLKMRKERMSVEGFRPVKTTKVRSESAKLLKSEREEKERLYQKYPNTVQEKALDAPGYTEKFDGITGIKKVDDAIYNSAKEILDHRKGTNYEDLHLIDANTGDIIHKLTTCNIPNGVDYDSITLKAIEDAHATGRKILAIHNHPGGLPPSLDDGVSAFDHGYVKGIAVGHNLEVYTYGKTDRHYEKYDCDEIHKELSDLLQFKIDFDDTTWYDILKNFGMEVKRR